MANTQAPANAEGPTQHTQNQAPRFTPVQLRMLHKGIAGNRVRQKQGQSHVEAWDIRRHLIRIFGFGGFSIETLSLDLVAERETPNGDRSRWTVVYRAQVRLTVYATDGREITHFEDGAAGDAINQPKLGDAHDMAMKTALSQALKRCAVNLGDQFGLGLYNGGKSDAVVHFSAPHPPNEWQKDAEPQPEPVDPPVQPEPEPQAAEGETSAPPAPTTPSAEPEPGKAEAVAVLKQKVTNGWDNLLSMRQNALDAVKQGVQGEMIPGGQGRPDIKFGDLINERIALLEQRQQERNVA
ncbi:Rad52/Rad22 family DNA repair protein [Streptomyces sioyaensis]|uniref:Rad52/Rad22 family DNA repair protein n=1 Tax=Streptomyces sioyaensis TaxID=67364 RepID=UPI0033D259AF